MLSIIFSQLKEVPTYLHIEYALLNLNVISIVIFISYYPNLQRFADFLPTTKQSAIN